MNRKLIKDLMDSIKASDRKKTSGYDTSAVVRRIEDGTAWVHIPGGVDETPVKLTINANVGDTVQVRVSGGRAFLVGNRTAPPTDDTTAIKATYVAKNAQETAVEAKSEASEAWHYAGTAKEAAESAQDSADSAAEAAIEAWNHADDAHQAAVSANNSANNALVQLSVVEDVAGTLRWISEHGSFVPTTDTTVIEGSVYFIYENGDYIPIANPDPSANPSQEGWYVLDVTESQAKYIMAHLAVTSAGLWVLPVNQLAEHPLVDSDGDQIIDSDNNPIVDFSEDPQYSSGYKVLLSGGGGSTGDFPIGLTIYNDEGEAVANYGTTTRIGSATGNNVYITSEGLFLREGDVQMASFSRTRGIILGEQQYIHIGNVDDGEMIDMFEVGSGLTFTLSHSLNAITNIFAHCRNTSSGEIINNVPLTSSDYSVSGNTVTITSPLASNNNLVPEELVVWYTTNDIVTQMSIGKNADTSDARTYPFVIGNNNESLDPSNVFQVSWSGSVYTRGHRLAIGDVVIADTNFSTTMTAGIDNYTNYAAMALVPGTYIVTARFGVTPSASSSGCIGLKICKDERNSAHVISAHRQLGNVNTSYYGEISHSCIVSITKNTVLYAIASCHYAGTVSARTFKAVCIG